MTSLKEDRTSGKILEHSARAVQIKIKNTYPISMSRKWIFSTKIKKKVSG